jgi:hypothetical protein
MTSTTVPMVQTYPQSINLDRDKLAAAIETLTACAQACTACRACGDECAGHAGMHEHCRICAEACRAADPSDIVRAPTVARTGPLSLAFSPSVRSRGHPSPPPSSVVVEPAADL